MQGAVEHVDEGHVVCGGERRGGFGADQPGAHNDDAPVREGQVADEREETDARRVLLGLLEPGHRRLRVAQACGPDECRGLDLGGRATCRAADDEAAAVEVALRHDPVDVLDALLGELLRVGQQRHATGQECAFGERRPIVRQARSDHRHTHLSLCEPSSAGVSGNTVADNHDRIAHTRIRARPEGARVGVHADRPSGNPQTWSARPEVRHPRGKSRIRSAYGYGCRKHPAERSSTSENARWRGKGSNRKDQRGCGRTRSARSRGSEAARTVRVRSGPGGDRVDRCCSHRWAEAKRSRGAYGAPGRPDHHSRHAGSAAAG